MGPFELLDLTGLDVSSKVMQSIYDQFQQEPRFRPSSLIPPRVAAGLFGRKTTKAGTNTDLTRRHLGAKTSGVFRPLLRTTEYGSTRPLTVITN